MPFREQRAAQPENRSQDNGDDDGTNLKHESGRLRHGAEPNMKTRASSARLTW